MNKTSSRKRSKSKSRSVAVPVPLPSRASHPFATMKVETAFVVPRAQESSIRSAASRAGKTLGRRFSVRRLTEEESEYFGKKGSEWIGVWRVA